MDRIYHQHPRGDSGGGLQRLDQGGGSCGGGTQVPGSMSMPKCFQFGDVKDLHLNLDRRTGYFKGYAIVQYTTEGDAAAAIRGLDGRGFLGRNLRADWAFLKGTWKR